MPLIAPKTGSSYKPVPEGMHPARCIRVIDMGTSHNEKWGKDERKIMVTFELPDTLIEDGELKGQPYSSSLFLTLSMHEKANMRKVLENWRGKKFTDEEAWSFDVLKMLNVPALVNVTHTERDGTVYANIVSVNPPMKGMTVAPAVNEVYGFCFDDWDDAVWDKLSDKLKERLTQTPEYQARVGGGTFDPNDDVPF